MSRLFVSFGVDHFDQSFPSSVCLLDADTGVGFAAHVCWPGLEPVQDDTLRRFGDCYASGRYDGDDDGMFPDLMECCGSVGYVKGAMKQWLTRYDKRPEIWALDLGESSRQLRLFGLLSPVYDLCTASRIAGQPWLDTVSWCEVLASQSYGLSSCWRGAHLASLVFKKLKLAV